MIFCAKIHTGVVDYFTETLDPKELRQSSADHSVDKTAKQEGVGNSRDPDDWGLRDNDGLHETPKKALTGSLDFLGGLNVAGGWAPGRKFP